MMVYRHRAPFLAVAILAVKKRPNDDLNSHHDRVVKNDAKSLNWIPTRSIFICEN